MKTDPKVSQERFPRYQGPYLGYALLHLVYLDQTNVTAGDLHTDLLDLCRAVRENPDFLSNPEYSVQLPHIIRKYSQYLEGKITTSGHLLGIAKLVEELKNLTPETPLPQPA